MSAGQNADWGVVKDEGREVGRWRGEHEGLHRPYSVIQIITLMALGNHASNFRNRSVP